MQKGFTLIELVVVIVILAILAVVALPRFMNLKPESERSVVLATAAAYEQAIDFAHTSWQIHSGPNQPLNDLPGYVGDVLDLNANGYPLGIDKNNPMGQAEQIGQGDIGCVSLWLTLLTDAPSVSLPQDDPNFDADYHAYRHNESGDNSPMSRCSYVYRAGGDRADRDSADLVIVYNSETGEVTVP